MIEFDPVSQIIYEDNHLLVINKNPTQIVQGDKTGDRPLNESIKRFLKEKYNKPGNVFLGVVHRIDRPASGLVLFAKTSKALTRVNEMIKRGDLRKTYWIIVAKRPEQEEGELENHLWKYEKKNKSFVVDSKKKGAKKALLHYRYLRSKNNLHLIEVELKTGRHHQIRVQFAHLGNPVKGDVKYGFPKANDGPFIHLHAQRLELTHPVTGEILKLEADPPEEKSWSVFIKE
ncbi:MAG: RluA family pseudouridine synthase [Bacteroidales bacterium]|nr:RluA family pseudouridine synthase [Bacteroidales bacterium]